MSGISEATRAQCEDAIRVLDAVIAERAERENFHNALDEPDEGTFAAIRLRWTNSNIHAQEQIEMYWARYGASR